MIFRACAATGLRTFLAAAAVAVTTAGCGGGQGEPPPATPVEVTGPPHAELLQLKTAAPLAGVMVEGRNGDWLIRNERIAVVVSGLDHRGSFTLSGGNILDAAVTGTADGLREIFTYFDDTFPRQAIYRSLEPGAAPGDSDAVILVATGHDSEKPSLLVETRYTLRPGSNYLQIVTTLTNSGADSLIAFELGDAIQWGRMDAFAPGPGRNLERDGGRLPFLAAAAEGTALAWVSPGADLTGPHGGAWSDPVVKTVDLPPGATESYLRRLILEPGSVAAVLEPAWNVRGEPLGYMAVTVNDKGGSPLVGSRVEALAADGRVMAMGETGTSGTATIPVPGGDYALLISDPRHGAERRDDVSIVNGKLKKFEIELPEPARLLLTSVDGEGEPSPARWTVEGIAGTPDPYLGPSYQASVSERYVFAPQGRTESLLPAGEYRVTATRGPAFDSWSEEITLRPGEVEELDAVLTRFPLSGNWISADLHVHALPSSDSNVALADRAVSLICEGVDWFAASDHGRRTDYSSVLDTLSSAAALRAMVSEEVTTVDLGHFSAFPLQHHPRRTGGGALDPNGMTPAGIMAELRQDNPGALIQVNHPRSGSNGYFDRLEFSAETLDGNAGFSLDFDVVEIMNGKHLHQFDRLWSDWTALLNAGHHITAVGNSDSHRVSGQEPGYPRNFVLLPDSEEPVLAPEGEESAPAPGGEEPVLAPGSEKTISETAVVQAIRNGRVVVTNGPMIEFTLDGADIGSTVSSKTGVVRAHVRVVAPKWVDVSRVRVFVGGREDATFLVKGRERSIRFEEDFELNLLASAPVVVKVEGEGNLDPVVPSGFYRGEELSLSPIAFTNPIWVEIPGPSR